MFVKVEFIIDEEERSPSIINIPGETEMKNIQLIKN
jgi:hypothetical protein